MVKFILFSAISLSLLVILGLGGFGLIVGLFGGLIGLVAGILGAGFGVIVGLFGGLFGIMVGLLATAWPLIGLILIIAGIACIARTA